MPSAIRFLVLFCILSTSLQSQTTPLIIQDNRFDIVRFDTIYVHAPDLIQGVDLSFDGNPIATAKQIRAIIRKKANTHNTISAFNTISLFVYFKSTCYQTNLHFYGNGTVQREDTKGLSVGRFLNIHPAISDIMLTRHRQYKL